MTTAEVNLETRSAADGVPVLVASGEVDITNAEEFRTALVAAAGEHPRMVVDLSALSYLDSAGLSALFIQAVHTDVELVVSDALAPIIEVSGLGNVADVRR